jgi:hypothetical protein
MPTTQTYYDQLIINSNAAAAAKKTALDQAYERMTTATFDDSGQISYKKDDKGNPLYGSIDVDYMNRTRQTGAGAESSGMLRSGQYTRSLAEGQAAYRSSVLGAKSETEAQKTQVDQETAQKQAEYKAMYGTVGGSSGGGSSGGGSSGSGSSAGTGAGAGLPPVTTAPGIGGTSTTKTPTAPTTNLTPSQQKGLATRNTVKGGFGATKSPQAAAGPAKSPTQVTTPKPTPQPKPVTTKPGQRVIRPGQVR